MKKLMLVLATTLMAASAPQTDEGLRVRYRDFSGQMSITVEHDMYVAERAEPIAARDFTFELTQAVDPAAATITVTIDGAKGSYEAHAQKQRLGTRHLTGRSFRLSIGDDGRQLQPIVPSEAPVIDLGPVITPGFSIAGVLGDILPVLPEKAAAVGTAWTTNHQIRSLEGWAWGAGRLTTRHRVTAVERRGSHTVVTVKSEAEANLVPIEGERSYSGDLKRTLRWSFDATAGSLLSMSMEQESKGTCALPQGEVVVRQLTKIEMAPRGQEKS